MKKDYSEYQLSEYDRYQILRSNRKTVMLDYFINTVRFFPEDRSFIIRVDRGNEYHMMQDYLDEYNEDEQKHRGARFKPISEEEEQEAQEQAVEDTAYFQMRQRIADLLSGLEETDVKLLTLRFGLEGGKPMSPEQAGRQLGLTPEEVVAREGAALAKLRKN